MNGSLIDTNVIIKFLNGNERAFDSLKNSEEIYVSVISVGELFYGAFKSSREKQNSEIIIGFLSEQKLLDIDEKTGQIYGDIKNKLVKKGINIPENDIWIAAGAIANKLKLITFDGHFSDIEELEVINP